MKSFAGAGIARGAIEGGGDVTFVGRQIRAVGKLGEGTLLGFQGDAVAAIDHRRHEDVIGGEAILDIGKFPNDAARRGEEGQPTAEAQLVVIEPEELEVPGLLWWLCHSRPAGCIG